MSDIRSTRIMIGLEIHVELSTRSKMFTRAPNVAHPSNFDAEPNTLLDPVVMALPGALPVMNRAAVEMSMMVGLALGSEIPERCAWDRKNYFYPDLPKGYQITQYDVPVCIGGGLDIDGADGERTHIRLIRAHLEEDTGKLGHELPGGHHYEGSLVDLNRAGTPLLEIVTEPDFTNADDVVTFAQELRAICRCLGVTEGIMQRGHMRFEPNINVIIETEDGTEYATPVVEVKNLNSFKALRGAIDYEAVRQVKAWKDDGLVMGPNAKTTRGWDDARLVTVLQREKEDAHDYRYFPDPDLLVVEIERSWRDEVAARLPELPMARRARYATDYGLGDADARALTAEPELCAFYEGCVNAGGGDKSAGAGVAKLLLNAGAKRANELETSLDALGISPAQVAGILAMRDANEIGSSAVDDLFADLSTTDDDARSAAERLGLLQVTDDSALIEWIDAAVAAEPGSASDFAGGADQAAGRLIGAVMKASGGKADAKRVREMLVERLRG